VKDQNSATLPRTVAIPLPTDAASYSTEHNYREIMLLISRLVDIVFDG